MKKIITILVMAVMGTAYGQADTDIVNIPDRNFKEVLIKNSQINVNGDTEITYGEARNFTGEINVFRMEVYSLIGIEAFVNITTLNVAVNRLDNLDISKNTALQTLYCFNNQLTNLDVSKNTALQTLSCSNNQLTNLDVSKNTALEDLFCSNNRLTQLNIANGNNNKFSSVQVYNNPNLMCIQIDRRYTPRVGWYKDAHALYSDNCNYPSLSTTEVKAENHLQILNPVKDNLVIKTTAKVERVEIYNTAGQLVKVLFKGNTQVQDLAKGVYILKITTDRGVITEKIIKQ